MITDLRVQDLVIDPALRRELPQYFEAPAQGTYFHNPWGHPKLPGLGSVLKWKLEANTHRPPDYRHQLLHPEKEALADLEALPDTTRIFWIGHASFLFAMDGLRIVVDPVFGRAGGVVPRLVPAAARAEELGEVSAVLVTHGHHDHLDPKSLRQLAEANRDRVVFIVPRGLGRALPAVCRPVVELSWWQYVSIGSVRIHLVPAQHWHQRGPLDRNRSLWGGFVVQGSHRLYHSGDTGYFGGFRAIGRAFGGLDAACLPLGAYEPSWIMSTQHMDPAASLAAWEDLQATHVVGMHWGTFDLSNEPLDAGVRWLHAIVDERQLPAERFQLLRTGGSIALAGASGQTRAVARGRFEP